MADPTNIPAPEVGVFAHPEGETLEAPRTNTALQLAGALAQTQPALNDALLDVGLQAKAKQEAKAQADALVAHGQAFGDAVRAGILKPTQNPWYIHEYNSQSAQVQAQGQLSQLQAQSQTWAERNDPQAFAGKWATEVGKIQQGITRTNDPIDAQIGFTKAAGPIVASTLAQNQAYNVDRIQAERKQDATTVATQNIMDVLKANPQATSDQIFNSLEDDHKGWILGGGTEHDWRLLVFQSFTGAAANMGDSSVMQHLKDPYLGGSPIANQADETGKSVGLQIDSTSYWIDRAVEGAQTLQYKQMMGQAQADGAKAAIWANQHYGADFAFGRVPIEQLRSDLTAQGYSGLAIGWVTKEMSSQLEAANSYDRAQIEQYSKDPTVSKDILTWNHEALTEGLSAGLHDRLANAVAKAEITYDTAMQIEDRAEGQSHWSISETRADRREAQGLQRTDRSLQLQGMSLVRDNSEQAISIAEAAMASGGQNVAADTRARDDLSAVVKGAGAAYVLKHPGDIQGAQGAAEDAANSWVLRHRRQGHAPSLQPGQNPR